MGLNPAKGNMYGFVTHTWNIIKGRCQHDCSYCYMKRWGDLKPVRFDEKELKTDLGSGNKIFVGSSCDMFAESINKDWIYRTIAACLRFDNEYLFQSKNPQRMLYFKSAFPNNSRVCTTIETNRLYPAIMGDCPPPDVRAKSMSFFGDESFPMITVEPILDFDIDEFTSLIKIAMPFQVNIGADSGCHKLPEPSWDKVQALIGNLEQFTKVFLKPNLSRLKK